MRRRVLHGWSELHRVELLSASEWSGLRARRLVLAWRADARSILRRGRVGRTDADAERDGNGVALRFAIAIGVAIALSQPLGVNVAYSWRARDCVVRH